MYFSKELLGVPLTLSNPLLAKIYRHKVRYEFNSFENRLVQKVSDFISQNLVGSIPTIEETSSVLEIPARTLQHKLKEAKTSYKALYTCIRRQEAQQFLYEDIQVETISFLIGYQNSSAFCKAFKKQFGQTPSEFSKSLET